MYIEPSKTITAPYSQLMSWYLDKVQDKMCCSELMLFD